MVTTYVWSEFQSVAQLSVALNAAFTGIVTLLGRNFVQEIRRLDATIKRLDRLPLPPGERTGPAPSTDGRNLRGLAIGLQRWHEWFLHVLVRPFCVLGFFVGGACLLKSSFDPKAAMDSSELHILLTTLAPFSLGIISCVAIELILIVRVTWRRFKLEQKHF